MALELVTGYWGEEHVTAEQESDLNAGIVGSGMYVLPIGQKMKAEAVTSNKIRIFDGLFMGYGRQCMIEEGAYEDIQIENGTAGLLRNDMIIIKYAKNEATGAESVSFGVLKGQTGATSVDPVPNNQDIRNGTFESEMPLYRVKLNGLAIESIEALHTVPKSSSDLTSSLSTLSHDLQVLSAALSGLSVSTTTYTDLSIDGTVYTGATELTYIRLQKPGANRSVYIGFVSSTNSSTAYTKYFSTNKLLIRKNLDNTWTSFSSI